MRLRLLRCIAGSVIVTLLVTACSTKSNSAADPLVDAELESAMIAGKVVYDQNCLACHLASGKGAPPMNPPLAKTSIVLGEKAALVAIVLNGMANLPVDGENYRNIMPGFPFLTDEEVASVLTYVRNSFGNSAGKITATEVAQARSTK